tara:strand:+ start:198 stop:341 length:144 start_codon:yes stop_codon:yes gene_type:complete
LDIKIDEPSSGPIRDILISLFRVDHQLDESACGIINSPLWKEYEGEI